MNFTTFEVTNAALPVTMGMPLKKTDAVLAVDDLALKNASAMVVPAVFTIQARWEGAVSDVTKPVKWLLIDFIPEGTGIYTLDDSNASAIPPELTVTDGVSDIRVETGDLDVLIPKSGDALISQFKISSVEQLDAATKPQLILPPSNEVSSIVMRTGSNGGAYGGVAQVAGQTEVIVEDASLFDVGQQVRFEQIAHFSYFTLGGVVFQEPSWVFGSATQAEYGGAGWIFARGTPREYVLPVYDYIYTNQIIGDMTPYVAELSTILEGDTIESYPVSQEPSNIIAAIDTGTNTITLTNALENDIMQATPMIAAAVSPIERIFDVQDAEVEESNALRVIVKQTATKSAFSNFLTVVIRYYFYAGESYARMRMTWLNASDDPDDPAGNCLMGGAKLSFPTDAAVTPSDDVITELNAEDGACDRIDQGLSTSTAVAGDFTVAVAEFAENFPSRLVAASGVIEYEFFPESEGLQVFYADWQKTWELLIGLNADVGLALVNSLPVIYDAQYVCDTKAVRHAIVPRKTWVEEDFPNDANPAEIAEAANRAERLMSCAYDLSACSSQEELGSVQRMTLAEWRISSFLYTGTNQYGQMVGWQYFGNTRDGDTDGYTFNRYDVPFLLLQEFLRGGDQAAYRMGNEHARYMAEAGTWPSVTRLNDSDVYFFRGLSRYERSPALTTGVQTPRPTHSWSEGLWLYWALTGDPIAHAAALLHRERARTWNYQGVGAETGGIVDGSMLYNEARGPGWAALELLVAYRYAGDSDDLSLVKQYLDNLRLSEVDQGMTGVWVAEGYEDEESTGTQPFNWGGYPFVAATEYIREKQFQGDDDTDMELFVIRVAKWLAYGDAGLSAPGDNPPFVSGAPSGENYLPYGSIYAWFPTGPVGEDAGTVALGDLCAITLSSGAFLARDTTLKALARKIFRDTCFFRDFPVGARSESDRATINFRNAQFPSSTAKVWAQTAQFLPAYLFEVNQELDLIPPLAQISTPVGLSNIASLLTMGAASGGLRRRK